MIDLPHLILRAALTLALLAGTGLAAAAPGNRPVLSAGVLRFADADTLVVADWRAGQLHTLQLPPAPAVPAASAKGFNLKDVSRLVARALGVRQDQVRFEDMAVRPGAQLAYLSLSVNRGKGRPEAVLVTVNASGVVKVVDLRKAVIASADIANRPGPEQRLWRDVPASTLTVTDMVFHEGKLYVAGLSNASFASTLRVFDFPFDGKAQAASVEMYHPVHNQLETRAPIRKMTIAVLDGTPTLVAAFTCSPLVTIPLKDLRDGAHIAAKTVAEFGWGSMPMGMVAFDAGQGPMVLLTHSHKSADLMTVKAIADAASQPGVTTPIQWPAEPVLGIKSTYVPMAGVARLDNQDAELLLALRRNEESGAMELVSIHKGLFLRLSDFVNEYDFADFRYPPNDGWRDVHRMLRESEGFPELAARASK